MVMEVDDADATKPRGRNIVIFSDGTGQRGGVYFDEARTNIYKLFRATRVGPDTCVDPAQQVAFYDPGLGTQATDGEAVSRAYRTAYNFVSQATGLGITRNIIDCYAAIIQLWRPGDRIYLFGFSRGAYTVRCVAAVLCLCGIPTKGKNGVPLKRDPASTFKIATDAVKTAYQHVSSSRDEQFLDQRKELAERFQEKYQCGQHPESEVPFFVGVFDTVAALSNRGSLMLLASLSAAALALASVALAYVSAPEYGFGYWLGWLLFDVFVATGFAYVYTHLKFALGLRRSRWWETVHLTTLRQEFYDEKLDTRISYARHAISVDERRADFARVKWSNQKEDWTWKGAIGHFQQIWFAGNHADIGGGYPENECRLSDISLGWMVDETQKLGDDKLIVDRSILQLKPSCDGKQHDETRSLAFRLAGKTDRELIPNATLHETVEERLKLDDVLQYDVTSPYRPECLRHHTGFEHYYVNVPLSHTTCWQSLKAAWKRRKEARLHRSETASSSVST
jgi:uncharacterized protein (DUF2235 family)